MTVYSRLFVLVFAALSVAACYPPTIRNPIGAADAARTDPLLLGSWIGEIEKSQDSVYLFFLTHKDGAAEPMEAIMVGPATQTDNGGWMNFAVRLGRVGDTGVMNVKPLLSDGEPLTVDAAKDYVPVRYTIDDAGTLRLFLLDEKAIEAAIRRGDIEGTFTESAFGDDVRVGSDAKALDAFFAKSAASLFTHEYGVFRRAN